MDESFRKEVFKRLYVDGELLSSVLKFADNIAEAVAQEEPVARSELEKAMVDIQDLRLENGTLYFTFFDIIAIF